MKESMGKAFQPQSFNRNSMIGFIAAILTVLSFCTSFAPIPLSTFICAPISLIAGTCALVTSIKALRQIRQLGERGRTLALIGAWTGGVSIIAMLCVLTLGVLLFPYFADFIKAFRHNL